MLSSCLSWLVLRATEAKLLFLLLKMRFNQPLFQTKTFLLTRLNCKFLFSIIQGQIKIQNITLTNYFTNDLIIWLNFSFFFLLLLMLSQSPALTGIWTRDLCMPSCRWTSVKEVAFALRLRSKKSYGPTRSGFWVGFEPYVFRFKGW